jgi:hypothetical protein
VKGDYADADLKYLEAIRHRVIKMVLWHVAQSQYDSLGLRSTDEVEHADSKDDFRC